MSSGKDFSFPFFFLSWKEEEDRVSEFEIETFGNNVALYLFNGDKML